MKFFLGLQVKFYEFLNISPSSINLGSAISLMDDYVALWFSIKYLLRQFNEYKIVEIHVTIIWFINHS